MIYYTMMPEELMFPTLENEFRKQTIIESNGVQLLVQVTDSQEYEVVRVLSSDPQHYLDMQFYPGQKITMSNSTNIGNYAIMK